MRETNLAVTYMDTADLVPYARNAKEHTREQVAQIAKSIEEFGFDDPVGVWTNAKGEPEIVEGHGRVLAAKKLGIDRVPVLFLDHLSDEERRAYTHIHNQTTLTSGFDMDVLGLDMAELGFDWGAFGFDMEEPDGGACSNAQRFADAMARSDEIEGTDEYKEFVEKFEPKKTTDDCYTPANVYRAVLEWATAEYGLEFRDVVRPFYPGGDYRSEPYPAGCVVVDNPPFSIISEIVAFYMENGVDFFLFAPYLTVMGIASGRSDVCRLATGCDITYENGAIVNTSFITNMDTCVVRSAPDLCAAVNKANADNGKAVNHLPKYSYPDEVLTSTMVGYMSANGVDFRLSPRSCKFIRALDAQKASGSGIFGSGFLLSEKAAAEKAAAEKAAAENNGMTVWSLSDSELDIVASLV